MSLDGLYRFLLFEVLKQCPDLIPKVFPEQWDLFSNDSTEIPVEEILFRPSNIEETFGNLVMNMTFPEHRFCFFYRRARRI
jgi:hypothetical protein